MSRFERQIPVFGEEGQKRISEARVAVFGCGGLGCNVITQLALAGIGHLTIVDGDTISESNLNRQFVYAGRTGMKADSMKEWIGRISPDTEVTAYGTMMTEDNVGEMLKDADIAVDCLDNNASRMILNDSVLALNKTLVHGAVDGLYGQATVIVPGETPCLGCILGRGSECVPAVGSAVSAVASVQATETLKLITGTGTSLKGKLITIDLENNSFVPVDIKRREGCPHCQMCSSK